jgi:hypothetical protein
MNLQEIIDEVNKNVDDELDNIDVIGWVNRCIDDLTPVARYQKIYPITTQDGVNTYSLPSDLTKIVQLTDNTCTLSPLNMSDLKRNGYKVFANQLILQPTPDDARQLTLYYEGNLPYLENMDDVPVIHQSFHDLFVLYAMLKFMYKDDEAARKADAQSEYIARKRDFVRFMSRSAIEPIKDVYSRWV